MVDLQQQQQTVRLYRTFREAITETVLFGTIVPNVGGVGWTQTFIDHCFYGIFDPFLHKNSGISRKNHFLCAKSLFVSGWVGGFTSLVQLYQTKSLIFLGGPYLFILLQPTSTVLLLE